MGGLTPFGTLPFFGDSLTLIPSKLSPKRDCRPKMKGLTTRLWLAIGFVGYFFVVVGPGLVKPTWLVMFVF